MLITIYDSDNYKFNSSIPSVRKVKNWLLNDPFHVWHGRDRLVVFFILAGDEAANAFCLYPMEIFL